MGGVLGLKVGGLGLRVGVLEAHLPLVRRACRKGFIIGVLVG